MPRLKTAVPKYRLHKRSGQAIVTLSGQDHYLGPYNTPSSRRRYQQLVGEWLASGRPDAGPSIEPQTSITELCARYWEHALVYYTKQGQPTDTIHGIKIALRFLAENYGPTPVDAFGPTALKSVRNQMIAANQSRRYVNDNIDRIRRVFRWGVEEELVPVEVYETLKAVPNLRKGRSPARETEPVGPVDDSTVEQTLPFLSRVVADMVRLQLLTGCRPGEICIIRPADIDTSGDVWDYRPSRHKTEHHGQGRIIPIGPLGQTILRRYLDRPEFHFCFSPAESEQARRTQSHARRQTPLSCGNRPGTNRKRSPKKTAGECYTNDSYRRAVHRACDQAFPPPAPLAKRPGETTSLWRARLTASQQSELKVWQSKHRWSPNQLRHAAATKIRSQYDLEAAQVVLGHSSANTTEIYAEKNAERAREVARQLG